MAIAPEEPIADPQLFARAAREVPFRITDPLRIPKQRYFDRDFFDMEKEHLWRHTWQMACRLEEIPEVGDFTEYEICDDSILVVRESPDVIRAFQNACPHRGTQLAKGAGCFRGGQIVCPFHGWRFGLDGANSFVYAPQGFDSETIDPQAIHLTEVLVDTWAGCVFINMDTSARPLAEALAPVNEILAPLELEGMRTYWWKETVLPANWKVAMEAFLEGYHVGTTHPQLDYGLGDRYPADNLAYHQYPGGHSDFRKAPDAISLPDLHDQIDDTLSPTDREAARLILLWEGQDAMVLPKDVHVIEGLLGKNLKVEEFMPAVVKGIQDYAEGAGIPLPKLPPERMDLWGGVTFVFPNFFILPAFGNAMAYRVRPYEDDPEKCLFEVWSLTFYPKGAEPPPPVLEGRFDHDDPEGWRQVPLQDFSNIKRQQQGMRNPAFEAMRLSDRYERNISNLHVEIDRYLAGEL